MVESARLESVYTLIAYRGFESLRLRQIKNPLSHQGVILLVGYLLRVTDIFNKKLLKSLQIS